MRYPASNFTSDFSVLEWLAMIVLLSSLFLSGRVLQVLEHEKIPFLPFYGKDGEDRTRDLTVHNLTFCLRRHCEEVDWKCYPTKCYSSCCLLNSFFLRNRHSKSSTMVRRFRWKNSIFAFFILNRPVAGAPRLVCKKNHANNKHSRVRLF